MKKNFVLFAIFGMFIMGSSYNLIAQENVDVDITQTVQDTLNEEVVVQTQGLFTPGNEAGTGMFLGLVSIIFFIIAVVLSIFFFIRARNKERMALIEKGHDITDIYKPKSGSAMFKWGLAFIGFSMGLFFGYLLATFTNMNDEVAYFSMIFLFGGASFIVYHFLNKKQLNG